MFHVPSLFKLPNLAEHWDISNLEGNAITHWISPLLNT